MTPYYWVLIDNLSYETVIRRWPVIVTSIVDHLHNACNDIVDSKEAETESRKVRLQEGKELIAKISELKYHMSRDHPLEPIPGNGESSVGIYNSHLAQLKENGKGTWFTAPWLFTECYLYQLLRSFFLQSKYWRDYDPFFSQKIKTFKQSGNSILQIATTMHEIEIARDATDADPYKFGTLFREMVQMCLWGNATDLSLLTHLSVTDIDRLQAVGKEAQAARHHFILRDDQEKVWEHVSSLKRGQIDIVLDNAGFELFTDLVFADFLVTFTPFVGKATFHPKLIPWFVSDVTPPDFAATLASLKDAPSFFGINAPPPVGLEHLDRMVRRWQGYLDEGVFSLSVPLDTVLGDESTAQRQNAAFWTSPFPYWEMEVHASTLHRDLKKSDLVIFKGDLNYRKLTGDIRWPAWTDFAQALGPLAGSFPLLSLRTNKADVVVGVDRETAERLDKSGEKWRVSGRYALISFLRAN